MAFVLQSVSVDRINKMGTVVVQSTATGVLPTTIAVSFLPCDVPSGAETDMQALAKTSAKQALLDAAEAL